MHRTVMLTKEAAVEGAASPILSIFLSSEFNVNSRTGQTLFGIRWPKAIGENEVRVVLLLVTLVVKIGWNFNIHHLFKQLMNY